MQIMLRNRMRVQLLMVMVGKPMIRLLGWSSIAKQDRIRGAIPHNRLREIEQTVALLWRFILSKIYGNLVLSFRIANAV